MPRTVMPAPINDTQGAVAAMASACESDDIMIGSIRNEAHVGRAAPLYMTDNTVDDFLLNKRLLTRQHVSRRAKLESAYPEEMPASQPSRRLTRDRDFFKSLAKKISASRSTSHATVRVAQLPCTSTSRPTRLSSNPENPSLMLNVPTPEPLCGALSHVARPSDVGSTSYFPGGELKLLRFDADDNENLGGIGMRQNRFCRTRDGMLVNHVLTVSSPVLED